MFTWQQDAHWCSCALQGQQKMHRGMWQESWRPRSNEQLDNNNANKSIACLCCHRKNSAISTPDSCERQEWWRKFVDQFVRGVHNATLLSMEHHEEEIPTIVLQKIGSHRFGGDVLAGSEKFMAISGAATSACPLKYAPYVDFEPPYARLWRYAGERWCSWS